MKYLVISDIHGSLDAIIAMEDALKQHGIKRIICLGDILYHGPRNPLPDNYNPQGVFTKLNQYAKDIIGVRGNCDSEVDQMVIEFPITADYNNLYLGDKKVFLSHGHIYGPDNMPLLHKGDIFISGHIHLPIATTQDEIYVLNPGSCALPKGGHPKTYAVLDESSFTIYTLDHQVYKAIAFKKED